MPNKREVQLVLLVFIGHSDWSSVSNHVKEYIKNIRGSIGVSK